ncbi:MAG: hypothetical protein R3225_07670 [Halofilum sp. (in: g-proteobacteria)]|nr:hypothetical protein [Halofilum sp. (in: g-proteobacteria)]
MNSITLLAALRLLLTVACVVGFGAAATLTTCRSRILADPEQARTYTNPIPPRRMLSGFGRLIHTILLSSAALALLAVVAIAMLG